MIKFLKIQYRLGKITDEQLQKMVADGKITEAEYMKIVGENEVTQ